MKIINLGFNPWSHYWKRNQTLFYLLSNMDRVKSALFFNPAIWIADLLRTPSLVLEGKSKYIITRSVSKKIDVKTPVCLPYSKKYKVLGDIERYMNISPLTSYGVSPLILILNDLQADQNLVDLMISKAFLTIFDWSDDFVEFSSNEEERIVCRQRCEYYCKNSDIVLTINENLRDRALKVNKNAHVVKNATNFFTFPKQADGARAARQISKHKTKIVGYIGWLNSLRLDLDLISFLVEMRPEYTFVFMGPMVESMPLGRYIPKMKNVRILPPVPYEEYPDCLRALDVCILPNLINAHTRGNDPIKIYDYLASGRPVVTTKTAGTESFSELLYPADDKFDFLALLDQAVQESSEVLMESRVAAARRNSWQTRFDEVLKILRPYLEKAI